MAELTFRDFAASIMKGDVDGGGKVLERLLGLDAAAAHTASAHFQAQAVAQGPAFMGQAMGLRAAVASGAHDQVAALLRTCFGLDGAALVTGVATLLPRVASQKVEITTADGVCPATVWRPTGNGPWSPILFFMDGPGIRPAVFAMAERMASHGYFVLLPDMFYRSGPYEPMNVAQIFSDPALRQQLRDKFMGKVDQAKAMSDTRAFLAFLDAQPDVVHGKVGTTGYCMGGGFALAAAGHFPDRFAAAAAYHPANLATDAPDSVHKLAGKFRGKLYIGRASDDPYFDDAMRDRLEAALREAHADYTLETYPAKHGWVPSDTPAHDAAQAERHWQSLFALFDAALH
jgi:carboxymethylenebutenolidase